MEEDELVVEVFDPGVCLGNGLPQLGHLAVKLRKGLLVVARGGASGKERRHHGGKHYEP